MPLLSPSMLSVLCVARAFKKAEVDMVYFLNSGVPLASYLGCNHEHPLVFFFLPFFLLTPAPRSAASIFNHMCRTYLIYNK